MFLKRERAVQCTVSNVSIKRPKTENSFNIHIACLSDVFFIVSSVWELWFSAGRFFRIAVWKTCFLKKTRLLLPKFTTQQLSTQPPWSAQFSNYFWLRIKWNYDCPNRSLAHITKVFLFCFLEAHRCQLQWITRSSKIENALIRHCAFGTNGVSLMSGPGLAGPMSQIQAIGPGHRFPFKEARAVT